MRDMSITDNNRHLNFQVKNKKKEIMEVPMEY